jgi:mono/diheme cytochrome c family protein
MGRLIAACACCSTLLVLVFIAGAAPHSKSDWTAPEEAKKLRNPLPNDQATLDAGKAIFLDKCAKCHDETGNGEGPEAMMYDVKPADFTDADMMATMADGEIFWKIGEGRRPMPSFKKQLTEEQRWQLVAYLRTFAKKPVPAAKPAAPKKR